MRPSISGPHDLLRYYQKSQLFCILRSLFAAWQRLNGFLINTDEDQDNSDQMKWLRAFAQERDRDLGRER